jgi:hypothetical protein
MLEQVLNIAEKFGVPVVLCGVLLWYIQRLVNLILTETQTELRENFTRLEAIIVKLINNAKNNELKQEQVLGSLKTMVNIFTKLIKKEKQ